MSPIYDVEKTETKGPILDVEKECFLLSPLRDIEKMLDVMSSSTEVNIFMGHEPNPKIIGFLARNTNPSSWIKFGPLWTSEKVNQRPITLCL